MHLVGAARPATAAGARSWRLAPPVQRALRQPAAGSSRRSPRLRRPACEFSVVPGTKLPEALSTHDEDTKEASRKFRRTVFDFNRWQEHRSTERYIRHMKGMLSSRMVRGLQRPIGFVVNVATAVCAYESSRQAGLLPEALPPLELHSREPFTLTAFALSLLLVFRTNSSYSRWLDARKTWGMVLNRSRDLVRQGLTWIPEERVQLRAMLCRWVPAFSRVLMCHLRQDSDVEGELQGVLLPHEVEAVLEAEHRPTYVLQVLSAIVQRARLEAPTAQRLDENLTAFEDCLGTCERILRTPIPLSYTRHTGRFMIIWLTLLPLILWEGCGWATIPLMALIAFLLLGIEEIGVSIEEPFSILPLEAICETALANVRELQATNSGGSGASGGRPRRLSANELVTAAEGAGLAAAGDAAAGNSTDGLALAPPHQLVQ